jgi:hypothetical protein
VTHRAHQFSRWYADQARLGRNSENEARALSTKCSASKAQHSRQLEDRHQMHSRLGGGKTTTATCTRRSTANRLVAICLASTTNRSTSTLGRNIAE